MVVLLIVAAVLCLPFILQLLGFAATGIVAGSIAAFCQALIGNVVAGSIFAVIQSFAAIFWGRFFGGHGIVLALIFIFALWKGYLWF